MRTHFLRILSLPATLSIGLLLLARPATALETTPFFTFNQSPVVQDGSGGVDFSLWLTGRERLSLFSERWSLLWATGGMIVGRGDVLPDMQRDLVGFGTIGVGWRPSDSYLLKTQLNGHTPFYRGSSLRELSVSSVQWVAGSTIAFTPLTELDISFSEDILVISSSPDFGIALALRTLF